MTDMPQTGAVDWSSPRLTALRARRHRRERMLRGAGFLALASAFAMLAVLVGSLVIAGHKAFFQTHVTMTFALPESLIDPAHPDKGKYRKIVALALADAFPQATRKDMRDIRKILSGGAPHILRASVVADPSLIGGTLSIAMPASDPFDQLQKGEIDRATPPENRRLSDAQIARWDQLVSAGKVSMPFNTGLFLNADSRFPELAGLAGAMRGSFFALLVCFALSFPIGIGAAIWLEEFAPKNRLTDVIEVNINNLAAVPSIVFGLLALAVFLGWFGMPRSAPVVGGMTLALMTLPTIIIATRAALKAVPPSIRQAAMGLGASRQQVVFHHVLPLAMPGILTGTIIGLAQALGETAPLLLIGMNAFITSAPDTPFDPATALPTQIFIWADSPERGFAARTAAAILVLLGFLVAMNAIAVILRRKFERRW